MNNCRIVVIVDAYADRWRKKHELRAAGVWNEVAALDPFALEKAIGEGKWAPEVLERLKAYLSTEKRYTVTLKEESG